MVDASHECHSTSAVGAAEVSVLVTAAPSGGQLSVSPDNGFAVTNSFELRAGVWTDDAEDYPLSYRVRAWECYGFIFFYWEETVVKLLHSFYLFGLFALWHLSFRTFKTWRRWTRCR